jgi:hypothetical protein
MASSDRPPERHSGEAGKGRRVDGAASEDGGSLSRTNSGLSPNRVGLPLVIPHALPTTETEERMVSYYSDLKMDIENMRSRCVYPCLRDLEKARQPGCPAGASPDCEGEKLNDTPAYKILLYADPRNRDTIPVRKQRQVRGKKSAKQIRLIRFQAQVCIVCMHAYA